MVQAHLTREVLAIHLIPAVRVPVAMHHLVSRVIFVQKTALLNSQEAWQVEAVQRQRLGPVGTRTRWYRERRLVRVLWVCIGSNLEDQHHISMPFGVRERMMMIKDIGASDGHCEY